MITGICQEEIRAGKMDVKKKRTEIEKFCRDNFKKDSVKKMAEFYEILFEHDSQFRLPLLEFMDKIGEPLDGRLKGVPLHSTICISPWGLQTEFPEMHLFRDLGLAFNEVLDMKARIYEIERERISWSDAKKKKAEIGTIQSKMKYSMRMCLICCFNLLEAYINGIAWEYKQQNDLQSLSENERKMIEGDQTSILNKLMKVPKIVTGTDDSPLSMDTPPLSDFRDLVKPFRDSIVHVSPYSAPERYGGYDKLSKIYDLEFSTVDKAVNRTLEILQIVHQKVTGNTGFPQWLPMRDSNGRFPLTD
ncbi:MAG TPA: hypothetical protein PK395_18135 [bacterium]|nr:hypothetical protein [bacterium]